MLLLTQAHLDRIRQIMSDASEAIGVAAFGRGGLSDDEIRRLVDDGWLEAETVGTLIDDAFHAGAISAVRPESQQKALSAVRKLVRANPLPLSPAEVRARDIARDRAGQYCKGLGNRYDAEVGKIAINADKALADRMRATIADKTAEAVARRQSRGELATALKQATQSWTRDWRRVAATELQTAHQEGYFETTHARRGPGAMMARIPDAGACKHCLRLYTENGKPIVRPMSWWEAQGSSNAGRKTADWKPVFGPAHPHCQCSSQVVPDGMQIAEDGSLEVIESEEKSLADDLEKGRKAEIGEVRQWKGGQYRKRADGKWEEVERRPEPASTRTGVIRVDPELVRTSVDRALDGQKWNRHGILADDLGSRVFSIETKTAKGEKIPVQIVVRQNPGVNDERGVSGSHHLTQTHGEQRRAIYLDVAATKGRDRDGLAEAMRSVLSHELAHAADPHIADRVRQSRPLNSGSKSAEQSTYYNKPEEVTARMQQIFRELNTPAAAKGARGYAESWSDEPGDERASAFAVAHVMRWSPTWKAIEEHLTDKNRRRILKAAAILIAKHVNRASEPVEKSTDEDLAARPWEAFSQPLLKWRGLKIRLENPEGDVRQWRTDDQNGATLMRVHYGYVEGTEGADGDEVDVFVGLHPESPKVYVIQQRKAPEFAEIDENKCMIGFSSRAEAVKAYLAHYDDPRFLGPVSELTAEEFVSKVKRARGELIKSYDLPSPNRERGLTGGLKIDPSCRGSSVAHVIDATAIMDAIEQAAKDGDRRSALLRRAYKLAKQADTIARPRLTARGRFDAAHVGKARQDVDDNRDRYAKRRAVAAETELMARETMKMRSR